MNRSIRSSSSSHAFRCIFDASTGPRTARPSEEHVRRISNDLDEHGRWISTYAGERLVGQPNFQRGFRYISSEAFSRNMAMLSEYLAPQRE